MAFGQWAIGTCGCMCPGGPAMFTCSVCNLPLANLTCSWTNVLFGNGSATMTWNGSSSAPLWSTACASTPHFAGLQMACVSGSIVFKAFYFTSGGCPSGGTAFCQSGSAYPLGLILTSHTCSPLSLTYSTGNGVSTGCDILNSNGFNQFVVTYP